MILFGDAAFVQTPFTADHEAWLTLLDQTEVAMAGESTALGNAIGLAIKTFEQSSQEAGAAQREKVVIVLTDGNDTASFVEPIDAAKVAAAKGVRIHVIAMGDPTTVGEQALDMDVINKIAKDTGGQAFQAKDRNGLQKLMMILISLSLNCMKVPLIVPRFRCNIILWLSSWCCIYWPLL